MRRLLIVIPALNEEQALPSLIDEVLCAGADLPCSSEVVVVDDGSTDNTAVVTEKRGVRVVRLCRNLGIGGAVQTGLRMAYREGFDCAVQVDGDGQHPPSGDCSATRPLAPSFDSRHRRRLAAIGASRLPIDAGAPAGAAVAPSVALPDLQAQDHRSHVGVQALRAQSARPLPADLRLRLSRAGVARGCLRGGAPSRRAIGRDAAAPGRAFQHRGVHVRLLHDQGDARRRAHLPEDRETRADDPAHCATVHLDAENELRGTRR